MKRMLSCLVMLLLVCTAVPSAWAETAADEIDTYDELCDYVAQLFGFEDQWYYPYRPTFLDPVNYCGYLSMSGGVKDDTYYAAYSWPEENVAPYLGYLSYWGYEGAAVECDIPGVKAWRMTSAASGREGRPLLQTVDVYHVTAQDVLVVAYSYLDAWLCDEWLENPDPRIYDQFDPGILPCILPINEDVTITVEEFFLTDMLIVTAPGPLSLAPYDAGMLKFCDLQVTALPAGEAAATQNILRLQEGYSSSDYRMMCVRISCGYGERDLLVRSLRAALADANENRPEEADCTDVPMLTLTRSKQDPMVFSPAEEGESGDLWLVFPPAVYREQDGQRLYFCLQDENAPWIGDLRDWRYINFAISYKDL